MNLNFQNSFFLRIDSRESPRFALRIARPSELEEISRRTDSANLLHVTDQDCSKEAGVLFQYFWGIFLGFQNFGLGAMFFGIFRGNSGSGHTGALYKAGAFSSQGEDIEWRTTTF